MFWDTIPVFCIRLLGTLYWPIFSRLPISDGMLPPWTATALRFKESIKSLREVFDTRCRASATFTYIILSIFQFQLGFSLWHWIHPRRGYEASLTPQFPKERIQRRAIAQHRETLQLWEISGGTRSSLKVRRQKYHPHTNVGPPNYEIKDWTF